MSKKKKKKHFHHAPTPVNQVSSPSPQPEHSDVAAALIAPVTETSHQSTSKMVSGTPSELVSSAAVEPERHSAEPTVAPSPADHASTVTADTPAASGETPAPVTPSDEPTPTLPAAAAPLGLPEHSSALSGLPWKAFVAGVLTAVIGWYLYTLVPTPQPIAEGGYPAVVARVNGEEISANDLVNGIAQTEAVAQSQGVDVSTEEARALLEDEALTVLTNTRLLVQAARAGNFEASDEEIESQLSILEQQFGSSGALYGQAASLGLTEADLRQDIAEQIIVDKYLRETVQTDEVTVTEEEIETVYNGLVDSGQELPPLASVASAIEAQLIGQKQQDLIAAHLETLRVGADIEILVE